MAAFGSPDVIHDNGLWRLHNHRLAVIARSRGIPRVVSTRGMLEPWALRHKWLKKQIAWWFYQRRDLSGAGVIHATSEAELENLAALPLGVPVRLIANGVDVPAEGWPDAVTGGRGDGSVCRTALFVGRIYPVKGLPMLVEAWARVRPRDWRLVIAGPDEAGHRREVERAVAAADLGGSISFAGPLDGEAKEAAYRNADLFVLPTRSESFGMAIAEALAHGLPVLTTTAAPWPALEPRGCGWRVDATVEGIEAGLRDVTALDAATLRGRGLAGRALVESGYQWSAVARQFFGLYEEVVRAKSASAGAHHIEDSPRTTGHA